MGWLTLLLVVIGIAIALVVARGSARRPGQSVEVWPFYAKKPLTQPEQVLYFRLTKALPDHIVLAQVQLSRLLGVKKGNNFQAWYNRINRMSADFVVCHKDSSIVAVIELDDASHEAKDRQSADAKKNKAFSSAGVRVVRWQTKWIPDEATIRMTILLNLHSARAPAKAAAL